MNTISFIIFFFLQKMSDLALISTLIQDSLNLLNLSSLPSSTTKSTENALRELLTNVKIELEKSVPKNDDDIINIEDICISKEKRTSVIASGIPTWIDDSKVLELFSLNFKGRFDLFNRGIDQRSVLLNFITPCDVLIFFEEFQGFDFKNYFGVSCENCFCKISYSKIQGRENCIKYVRSLPVSPNFYSASGLLPTPTSKPLVNLKQNSSSTSAASSLTSSPKEQNTSKVAFDDNDFLTTIPETSSGFNNLSKEDFESLKLVFCELLGDL
jgi:hypothetical protein